VASGIGVRDDVPASFHGRWLCHETNEETRIPPRREPMAVSEAETMIATPDRPVRHDRSKSICATVRAKRIR
jgi:hypothetical protein